MQFLDAEEIFPTGLLGKIALGINIGIHERIELFAESPNVCSAEVFAPRLSCPHCGVETLPSSELMRALTSEISDCRSTSGDCRSL
jgi:hypothetical protein